jgi:hypothetical protein
MPADQSNNQHVRSRRSARNRKHIRELLIGEPMMVFNHLPVQFGQHSVNTTDRD